MIKKIVIPVLVLLAIGLAVACVESIYADIRFDEEKTAREQLVIDRLLQLRDAEEEFKKSHRGYFCGDIDSLVDWVRNDRAIDRIIKEGELTDDQLEAGLTEADAVAQGLIVRDTVWITAAEKLGIDNADSLLYVPVGKAGAKYQLRKKEAFNLKSNEFEQVCEIRASLDDYLDGLSAKRIKNLKSDLKKRSKNRADLMLDNADQTEGEWYGLRVGDLEDPQNKLAGNWE